MQELEPDGAAEALMAIAEAALPADGETVEAWSEREVMRLAVVGRLAGDVAGPIAAHRLLADMHGSLRGGYGERRRLHDDDMTVEEQEAAILEAADEIRQRRKEATSALAKPLNEGNGMAK